MKKIAALAAFAACLVLAVSGQADVYEYEPGPFDKLVVRADIDIVYRNVPDSAGYIRYESSRDFSQKLEVSCNKGKLTILDKMTEEDYGKLPTLYMYSDYLLSVNYEGTGTVDLLLQSATPTFSAKLTGNGKIICNGLNTTDFSANIVTGNGSIVAHGRCAKAKFSITGAGLIQADGLVADDVKCSVMGTGSIGCRPLENLDVRGIGTTKIYYYGDPTIKKVGGARLEKMPEENDPAAINTREPALPSREVKTLPVVTTEPDEAGLEDD